MPYSLSVMDILRGSNHICLEFVTCDKILFPSLFEHYFEKVNKGKVYEIEKSTAVRKEGKLLSIVDNIIINRYIDK